MRQETAQMSASPFVHPEQYFVQRTSHHMVGAASQ